ncbi:Potassium voltage-gated channel protein Shab [Diplonema papillatum]|nr:Potassium voltage-gated channel protein Shab [Diplonema papillatum]
MQAGQRRDEEKFTTTNSEGSALEMGDMTHMDNTVAMEDSGKAKTSAATSKGQKNGCHPAASDDDRSAFDTSGRKRRQRAGGIGCVESQSDGDASAREPEPDKENSLLCEDQLLYQWICPQCKKSTDLQVLLQRGGEDPLPSNLDEDEGEELFTQGNQTCASWDAPANRMLFCAESELAANEAGAQRRRPSTFEHSHLNGTLPFPTSPLSPGSPATAKDGCKPPPPPIAIGEPGFIPTTFKEKAWLCLEVTDTETLPYSRVSSIVVMVGIVFILISVVAFVIESYPKFYATESVTLFAIEAVCIAYFTVELGVRAAFCPEKKEFWTGWYTWIDVLSVFPFYITLFVGKSAAGGLFTVRILRLMRIFRVFKVSKYNDTVHVVFGSLRKSTEGLYLMLFLVMISTIMFSSALYFVEREYSYYDKRTKRWYVSRPDWENGVYPEESPFQSVAHTFWWALVTLTTVGYGNEVPRSAAGKAVAVCTMLCGTLVIAFPMVIIGQNFQEMYAAHCRKLRAKEKKRAAAAAEAAAAAAAAASSLDQSGSRVPRYTSSPGLCSPAGSLSPLLSGARTQQDKASVATRQSTQPLSPDRAPAQPASPPAEFAQTPAAPPIKTGSQSLLATESPGQRRTSGCFLQPKAGDEPRRKLSVTLSFPPEDPNSPTEPHAHGRRPDSWRSKPGEGLHRRGSKASAHDADEKKKPRKKPLVGAAAEQQQQQQQQQQQAATGVAAAAAEKSPPHNPLLDTPRASMASLKPARQPPEPLSKGRPGGGGVSGGSPGLGAGTASEPFFHAASPLSPSASFQPFFSDSGPLISVDADESVRRIDSPTEPRDNGAAKKISIVTDCCCVSSSNYYYYYYYYYYYWGQLTCFGKFQSRPGGVPGLGAGTASEPFFHAASPLSPSASFQPFFSDSGLLISVDGAEGQRGGQKNSLGGGTASEPFFHAANPLSPSTPFQPFFSDSGPLISVDADGSTRGAALRSLKATLELSLSAPNPAACTSPTTNGRPKRSTSASFPPSAAPPDDVPRLLVKRRSLPVIEAYHGDGKDNSRSLSDFSGSFKPAQSGVVRSPLGKAGSIHAMSVFAGFDQQSDTPGRARLKSPRSISGGQSSRQGSYLAQNSGLLRPSLDDADLPTENHASSSSSSSSSSSGNADMMLAQTQTLLLLPTSPDYQTKARERKGSVVSRVSVDTAFRRLHSPNSSPPNSNRGNEAQYLSQIRHQKELIDQQQFVINNLQERLSRVEELLDQHVAGTPEDDWPFRRAESSGDD